MTTEIAERETDVIQKLPELKEPEGPYVIADPSQSETVKSLLEKVTWLMQSITNDPVVPILENLLFSKGYIYASTLQISQIVETNIKGTFTIPAKHFHKILKTVDKTDVVSFNSPSEAAVGVLINGKQAFKFNSEHPMDFPRVPKCDVPVADMLSEDDFGTLMTIKKYASNDELREAMTCVQLRNGKAVATNGHWLVVKDLAGFTAKKDTPALLIQSKIVSIIKGFKSATIKQSETIKDTDSEGIFKSPANTSIVSGDRAVIFRTVDEKFPDYENVIPTNNNITVFVNRKELTKNINLALLTANEYTHQGRFSLVNGSDKMKLSSEDLDFSHEFNAEMKTSAFDWSAPMVHKLIPEELDPNGVVVKEEHTIEALGEPPAVGDTFEIGVNLKFLLEIVKDIESDDVRFDMSAPNKAIMLNKDFLVMPVMLNQYV